MDIIDKYFDDSFKGFQMTAPISDVILSIMLIFGLIVVILMLFPFFVIGFIFKKREM